VEVRTTRLRGHREKGGRVFEKEGRRKVELRNVLETKIMPRKYKAEYRGKGEEHWYIEEESWKSEMDRIRRERSVSKKLGEGKEERNGRTQYQPYDRRMTPTPQGRSPWGNYRAHKKGRRGARE
jgi:hypothetical protein